MSSDKVKTTPDQRQARYFAGLSTVFGLLKVAAAAFLAYKGAPDVAVGVLGATGAADIVRKDTPLTDSGV